MSGKTINIIMLTCVFAFSIIFGLSSFVKDHRLQTLDSEHDEEVRQTIEDEEKDILNDILIQNKNDASNSIVLALDNTDEEESGGPVTFTNFLSMYEYAEQKLANASHIYSYGSGVGTLNATTSMSGIELKNQEMGIKFTRAQADTTKYFVFDTTGNLKVASNLVSGTFGLRSQAAIYSQGSLYYLFYNFNNYGWHPTSKMAIEEKFNWSTNQTFHIANSSTIFNDTLVYDNYSKTHIGTAELKTPISSVRSSKVFMAVLDADKPAEFLSTKITVVVDNFGNFKSIQCRDKVKVKLYQAEYDFTTYATIDLSFTETFTRIGKSGVTINKPSLLNI